MKTQSLLTTETIASIHPPPVGPPKAHPDTITNLIASSYPTLRRQAAYYFMRERPGHLLEPGAVLNESFIRMKKRSEERWTNEAQVVKATSLEMRRTLVESARASRAAKRGGRLERVPWDEGLAIPADNLAAPEVILAVRQLLGRLEKIEPQMAHLINLHYSEGRTIKEIATDMNLSKSTVKSKLIAARAWLRGHLERRVSRSPSIELPTRVA
jgi:RNA polymerase sigma-70 factor (ECF subfamily)